MQPPIRPYHDHTPPAVRHVVETADVLGVAEPEVFRLAYRYHYARALDEQWLDELFAGYLLREELPGWVRSYCARVLNLADVGQLDPRDFGIDSPGPHRALAPDQQFASWLTLGGFVAYLLLFT